MSGRSVILAVEDKLSEAVSTKILEDLGIDISQRLGLKGKGYLQLDPQVFLVCHHRHVPHNSFARYFKEGVGSSRPNWR